MAKITLIQFLDNFEAKIFNQHWGAVKLKYFQNILKFNIKPKIFGYFENILKNLFAPKFYVGVLTTLDIMHEKFHKVLFNE